jgi:DNA-directed RNA polymerase subunit M/transcription elongation factor TFIIS
MMSNKDKSIPKDEPIPLKWECPKCGKVIVSLYQKQLVALREQHKLFCKGK